MLKPRGAYSNPITPVTCVAGKRMADPITIQSQNRCLNTFDETIYFLRSIFGWREPRQQRCFFAGSRAPRSVRLLAICDNIHFT